MASAVSPNVWRAGPTLHDARTFHATATLADGRILMVGGQDSTSAPTNKAETYSPSTGAWTPVAAMGTNRVGPVAATLANGKVLVAGSGLTAEVYNPGTDSWTPAANAMRDPRGSSPPFLEPHEVTVLSDGRALLAGSSGSGATVHADLYDPSDNHFHAAADMGTARIVPSQALLPGGKVLVVGGADATGASLSSGEVYDPTSDTWTPVANSMPSPHASPIVSRLPSGKVLIAGGAVIASGPVPPQATTDAVIYDPATNRFTATGSMTTARLLPSAVTLNDGRLVVAGGVASFSVPGSVFLNSAETYYPATGMWAPAGTLVNALVGGVGAALPGGEAILAGGTDISGHSSAATQIYSPATAPSAPSAVRAIAGNGEAVTLWSPPDSAGGLPLTGYTIRASTGAAATAPGGNTAYGFPGLPNGRAVTFTVTAENALGAGPASAPSAAVTPSAPAVPDTTAPTLKITGVKSKLKLKAFLKGVSATLTPSEASSLSVDLQASASKASIARSFNLTLASKSFGLGGARKLKLKPSKTLVGKARKFTVRLRVIATDAAGNHRTVTKTIRVSP